MIQKEILQPGELKIVSEKNNKGEYEIDKLYPGYGHTLGNSLRRVILSSIPGVAVTRVFIEGIPHEFSAIEGVKEDAINIILNLKKVVFKLNSEEPMTLTIEAKKQGEITAKDINLPSQVEIVNPDQYLFTLEKNKSIKIEFEISKGLGYVPKEHIKGNQKLKVGEIVMDSNFTPIRIASYKVTNTRVGDRTDFNKISFFIETDGSVTPTEVIKESIQIMIEQLQSVLGIQQETESESFDTGESIAVLEVSGDILEKIATSGIVKLADLRSKTDEEILEIDGITQEKLEEIKKALEKHKQ
ncbi:DNA-directed RNA polymerase subunit alpha [Candidatus Campbellbacteria bacterium]|nr:MAG: DNA-directed RNA polymerase subunit alpha [Candidatus Campbellbacteria bacterium]